MTTPAAAQPAKCVNTAGDGPLLLSVAGGKARFCYVDSAPSCYSVDLATGQMTTAPPAAGTSKDSPHIAQGGHGPTVEVTDSNVKVCSADGKTCKTLTPKDPADPGMGLMAAVNDTFTLGALTNLSTIETFDLATGKRLAKFKAGTKNWACSSVAFAGDVVVVTHEECGDSTKSMTWLATKTGKKIAALGGDKPITAGFHSTRIDGNVWAFPSNVGDVVVFQDVKTGKVTKRIAIGPATADAPPTPIVDGKQLVLIFGHARGGDVAIVDLATDKVTNYAAKRCP